MREEATIERLLQQRRGACRRRHARDRGSASGSERVSTRFPGRILVAVDAREGRVVTHGWTRTQDRDAVETVRELSALPLAGVLVTAVEREGRLAGPDLDLTERAARPPRARSTPPAASRRRRIFALSRIRGVAAAVLGMALYTGALDARAVAEEFAGHEDDRARDEGDAGRDRPRAQGAAGVHVARRASRSSTT